MIATFRIEGKVPRVNNAYGTNKKGSRYLITEYTNFKKRLVVEASKVQFAYDPYKDALEVEIYFYQDNLFTTDKKGKRISLTSGDYDGLIKIVQDAIMKGLKINDAVICKSTILKLPSENNETIFIVKTFPLASI